MKIFTLLSYAILVFSWLYVLIFSIKELKKDKFSSNSLLSILFIILIIDSIRTIIESAYYGIRLAANYEIISYKIYEVLSEPTLYILPKIINELSTFIIIILILKKWYPARVSENQKLKNQYKKEKENNQKIALLNKNLDKLVKEKTEALEKLNKDLEKRVQQEIEKNKIQEQKLFNQSKMAAMGEMLNNISHQWKQPLSTISVISSGLKLKSELNENLSSSEIAKDMDNITLTTQHMADTIMDFQNFFRPHEKSKKTNFKKLIDDTLKIIYPMIKANNIEIKVNIECEDKFEIPYNEFTQILMTLITNSKDALIQNSVIEKFIKIECFCNHKNYIMGTSKNLV